MDQETPHLPPYLNFETSIPGHFLRSFGSAKQQVSGLT
jgi:hypothetical protein